MSLTYSVDVKIDATYGKKTIKNILDVGMRRGFYYSKFVLGKIDYSESPRLSIDEALKSIFEEDHDSDLRCVIVRAEDTFAVMFFIDYGIHLTLMLANFSYPWLKKFQNGYEDLDMGRYSRVLLNLIEGYRILELNIVRN